ncbi:substrate-binding periplasmic protein [Algibacillus agarilyticus]|uniref:substrate-binding periplasmic protein n=1 Tax=Algibacillus agarilyticus TaxID=2234133 RepID=UPI000DCF9471|nr:ABC transporter substrate-binding protein [Algibacillus agarilyticus]
MYLFVKLLVKLSAFLLTLCILCFFCLPHQAMATQFKSSNTITVATHIEPPLINIENGMFVGQNADIARLLAQSINKKISFIKCPFARCLAMAEKGQADMMIAIRKTAERETYLDFLSQPFSSHILPVRFYVRKNSKLDINQYDHLLGLKIGMLRGATFFERFDQDHTLQKITLPNHNLLVSMLIKGRIDTFLGREVSIEARTDKETYQNEMKMAPYIYQKKVDAYIAVSKKSPLRKQVPALSKNLITLLNNGAIEKLLIK